MNSTLAKTALAENMPINKRLRPNPTYLLNSASKNSVRDRLKLFQTLQAAQANLSPFILET